MVAWAMLSLAGAAQAANIVQNPNFDLDSPAPGTAPEDWTLTQAASGSDFYVGLGYYGAFSGPNAANFGAAYESPDVLSQTLATTPGQTYTISFELALHSGHYDAFSASFGGTTLLSLVNDESDFGYTLETFTATATSSSTLLSFAGRNTKGLWDLDNVSVTADGVPEPATWAMMLVGFGGLGAAMRSRRKQIVTA